MTRQQREYRAHYVQRAMRLRRKLTNKALAARFNVCVKTIKTDAQRPLRKRKR